MEHENCPHAYIKFRNFNNERIGNCIVCGFEMYREPIKDYSGKALREIRAKKGVGRPINYGTN